MEAKDVISQENTHPLKTSTLQDENPINRKTPSPKFHQLLCSMTLFLIF